MASTNDKFRKAFNSANPVTTYVTSSRSSGATTLSCNNLTGWPTDTAVDFVTYQLGTDGTTPVAGTQIDWKGIVSGSNITNLTRVAGATDTGNAVNDVVEAMPTASWGNDLITGILNFADQDATLKAGAVDNAAVLASNVVTTTKILDSNVTTAKLADSAVTSSKVAAGVPVQVVSTNYSAVATGTTTIPYDDTIPQNTEGTQFMTQAITPKSSTNRLLIEVTVACDSSATGDAIIALFQDSTANALAANAAYTTTANGESLITLRHDMQAGTTSATTFKVRGGLSVAGTFTFNGFSGSRRFGGITLSNITITEYKA